LLGNSSNRGGKRATQIASEERDDAKLHRLSPRTHPQGREREVGWGRRELRAQQGSTGRRGRPEPVAADTAAGRCRRRPLPPTLLRLLAFPCSAPPPPRRRCVGHSHRRKARRRGRGPCSMAGGRDRELLGPAMAAAGEERAAEAPARASGEEEAPGEEAPGARGRRE